MSISAFSIEVQNTVNTLFPYITTFDKFIDCLSQNIDIHKISFYVNLDPGAVSRRQVTQSLINPVISCHSRSAVNFPATRHYRTKLLFLDDRCSLRVCEHLAQSRYMTEPSTSSLSY